LQFWALAGAAFRNNAHNTVAKVFIPVLAETHGDAADL
jgi:hypothetical protein